LRYRTRFGIGSRADDTDARPLRISRQISDRHILHIDRLVTVARGASLNDTNLGDAARGRDRFVARQIAKHLIGLAADLRDRRPAALAQSPWGTRTISEIPDRRSGTRKGPAANRDQRHIASFGLHAVDVNSLKLLNGTTQRVSVPSHRVQCLLFTFRMLVVPPIPRTSRRPTMRPATDRSRRCSCRL
jgi:hypothetical protein